MGCLDKGGSKSVSTSFTPEQAKTLGEALNLYGGELGRNENVYPGQRVAGLTGLQAGALGGAENYLDVFGSPKAAGTPLFDETGRAAQNLLAGERGAEPMTGDQVADYFGRAIYDPTLTTLKEDVLPLVDESFAGPGFFGSARSNARTDVIENTADWLGEQRAGLEFDVLQRNQQLEESAADRALSTLSPAMAYGQIPAQEIRNNLTIAAQQLGGLGTLFGFGEAEQTQEQKELNDAIVRFAEENQITDPQNLSVLLNLLGMHMQTSVSTTEQPGLGAQYFGDIAAGSGALSKKVAGYL